MPGGSDAILDVGGQDGTETFETVHNKELLESMGFQPEACKQEGAGVTFSKASWSGYIKW